MKKPSPRPAEETRQDASRETLEAADALDSIVGPGVAVELLRAAARAEKEFRTYLSSSDFVTLFKTIALRANPIGKILAGFVEACPSDVNPLLARFVWFNVWRARTQNLGEELYLRPLRESIAAVVPTGVKGKPPSNRRRDIAFCVASGMPLALVAIRFGVKEQTIRSTVSDERRRQGLPPLRKRKR